MGKMTKKEIRESADNVIANGEWAKLKATLAKFRDQGKADRIRREVAELLRALEYQAGRWMDEPADSKEEPMPEEFLFGLRFGPVGEGDEDGASGPG